MDFFDVIEKRRSIRRYTEDPVPDSVVEKALDAALLAPNSSNVQTWNFYWVQSNDKRQKLVEACLSQSAARKAKHLVVVTADPCLWKRSQPGLIEWVKNSKAPRGVLEYYKFLIPFTYRWGLFNFFAPFKFFASFFYGLIKPMARGPFTKRAIQLVAIKSAALAAENFVLAITAQGYSTCMMEGIDSWRIAKILNLARNEKVVMVVSVGKEAKDGTWGGRYRIDKSLVIKKI